ncbi:hypothetical protein AVEN_56078-1 [Araneus ventricosus]|uniref:Uncharacterized protein n=2 Tax=Araneus ventricosus TaxID=182803 RepID=A0A4Y2CV78_ARAVE|nr:hypothetical protein AVEN_56078-1 [Araneus ventricosus]
MSKVIHRAFIPQNTTEQFGLSDDDENDFPVNEDDVCKIKDFSEALRYSEELEKFFLCKGDSEGLAKVNDLNIHIAKHVFNAKKKCQTLLTEDRLYFCALSDRE